MKQSTESTSSTTRTRDFEAEDDEQAKEIGPTLDPMSEMIFAEDWEIDLLEDGAFCKEVE